MCKINVKKSILETVEENNLEVLKIDLMNDIEFLTKAYGEERNEFCKVYTNLEDLDFEIESVNLSAEIYGAVYCRDKDTNELVWITSCGDECSSWWEVNRVPYFYKGKEYK